MNIRTKIIIITSLLAVWSCSEKEQTPVVPDDREPIEFGSVSTRALVNSIADVDAFGVSIAISNNDNSAYGSLLSNEKVYPTNEAHTVWDYDDKRYWLSDSHFYFIASYPYDKDAGFKTEEITEDGVTRIAYTLNVDTYDETAHDHIGEDILTAAEHVNTSTSWDNIVNINLRHLLTNVNLEIKQDVLNDSENRYYITGISLYGISTSGTYALIADGDQIYDIWNLQNPNVETSFDKVFNNHLLDGNNALKVWGDEGLLLIPQDIIREKVKIRIDYLYELKVTDDGQGTTNGSNNGSIIQQRSETINLPATDQWKSGNKIKYTLSFAKPTKIVFTDITVKPWGSAQSGGTIIIK